MLEFKGIKMSKDYSEKLRSVKYQMEVILQENDISGLVILADGDGHGEFAFCIDKPSWSKVKFEESGIRVQINSKTPEENLKANKTINAIVITRDILANQFLLADELIKLISSKVEIVFDKNAKFFN